MDAFHRHTSECEKPDLKEHTLCKSPYQVQILAKLIYGDTSQDSGHPRGTLDGKGHEEAGECQCPHLGGGYMGAHMCRNSSFCTHKLCALY